MNFHVGNLEPAAGFKVGDRVRLKENEIGDGGGREGEITQLADGGWAVVLIDAPFDGWGRLGREWGTSTSNLERASAPWTSAKFKVGDRVTSLGDEGVVVSFGSAGASAAGRIADKTQDDWRAVWCKWGDGSIGWLTESCLESTAPARHPHIVILTHRGRLLPSENPHVHNSQESAETEARRLAAKDPGKEFAVYALVSTSATRIQPAETVAA